MKTWKDRICLFFASAFGLGLMPVAPGSFGALLGVAMHLGVVWWVVPQYRMWALLACFVAVCAAHFILTPWAQKYWNDTDPGHFVLDEVAGYLVVPIALMMATFDDVWGWGWELAERPYFIAVVGFLLFRIFDIIKLPGARYIDRNWHGAWGVLLDDIVSGIYASVAIWLLPVLLELCGVYVL